MIFSEVLIEKEDKLEYQFEGTGNRLTNLSRVNMFVGANNSGKSRLMRSLYSSDKMQYQSDEGSVEKLGYAFEEYYRYLQVLPTISAHKSVGDSMAGTVPRHELITRNSEFTEVGKWIAEFERRAGGAINHEMHSRFEHFKNEASLAAKALKVFHSSYTKVYVPVLRGLRPLDIGKKEVRVDQSDYYKDRTILDYKFDNQSKDIIHTGLNVYQELQKMLLGTQKERESVRQFELFLQKTFFQGKEVNLVPRLGDDVLHVNIGGEEYEIFNIGDGIQSIILLTYPLFFHAGKRAVFFFEEPETHLHPGFQRVFIETLMLPIFSDFQYFITTHSNHFLDLTLEYDSVSVFSFEKKRDDSKSVFNVRTSNRGESGVLELLGVRNSSVFLSNCTIWVEGITDRLYIRKYLEVYQKKIGGQAYKEDLHYSFVEYGGGNITHWSFLDDQDEDHKNIDVTRLCGTLMLIADSDNATGKKKDRHEQLRKVLGERFVLLEVTEIENLLTKPVIMKTVQQYCPKDSIDFQKFEKGTYEKRKLGTYLDATLTGAGRTFAADSGTINDKVNFCKRAISNIKSIEDISQDAKDLAKKIYEFIKSKNS